MISSLPKSWNCFDTKPKDTKERNNVFNCKSTLLNKLEQIQIPYLALRGCHLQFLFKIIYIHEKNKKNNADTSLQGRRLEKHMVGWL